ncbi:MAG: threonine--tRNA ligase, partial [Spirochaetes bacterium]|nr:threonine--tRNA ligase [Spirochaetota bacterium]
MRILGIHSKFIKIKAIEKATYDCDDLAADQKEQNIDQECVIIFMALEKEDEKNFASVQEQLLADTNKRLAQLGCSLLILYPYVHLTSHPASPKFSLTKMKELEKIFAQKVDVVRAPFGWYKSFQFENLGHPLSEWSAHYHPGDKIKIRDPEKEKRKGAEFSNYIIVDLNGKEYPVNPDNFLQCPVFINPSIEYQNLKIFVENEFKQGEDNQQIPMHIKLMKEHKLLDYCEVSEKGHFKWYPKGLLIHQLMLDYAAQIAYDWGAFQMKNPLLIRGDHNVVGELMGEFHERDYQVDGGRGICYLRYASDPLAFPFMNKVRFSHKQSPLKVYEEANCFRNEQQGEVSGLKRVRNFHMTDMHAACISVKEAQAEFEKLCFIFADIMNNIISNKRWVLGWEGTVDFYQENKDWLINISKQIGVPAFFKLMPQMSHYYAIKNEFQAITEDQSNIQVSTVQWDVKDGPRFDIGYINEEGNKIPCPVILHASSFGSIERSLCALLENIALDIKNQKIPMFPLWLSPSQVRIIPLSENHLDYAKNLCRKITQQGIRIDVDDRSESLSKRIRDAEKEWLPYIIVIGNKEIEQEKLSVRIRSQKENLNLNTEQIIELIKEELADMPQRKMMWPQYLSKRPI